MSPSLSDREGFVGQKGGEAALEGVRTAANRMCSVTVVTALSVKAQVAGRTDEERLEQLAIGDLINFRCNVKRSTGNRHRSAKTQEPANVRTTFVVNIIKFLNVYFYKLL